MGLFGRKKNKLPNPPDHPVQPPPPAAPTTNGEKVETNRVSGQLTDRLSSVPDGRPPEPSQVRDSLAGQSDAQRVWSHPQKQAQDWRHLWDERNQESRARVPGIVPPVENPFRDFSRHNQNSVNQVTINKPPSPLSMPYDDQQSTSPRRSKAHRRRRVDESNEPPSPLAMPYDDQRSTSPRSSKAHQKGRVGHMTLLDRADRVSETFPNEMIGKDSVNQFTINEPPSPLAMPYDDQQSTSPRSSKAHRKGRVGHMAILDRADRVSETFPNEMFGDEAAAEYEHQSNIENGSVQDITAVHSTIVQSIQFCLKSKKGPKTKRFNIDMNAVKDIASLFTASPYQLGLQETQTTSSNQFDCDFTKGQMRLGADVEKSCQFGNASERANFFEQSPRLNCLEQLASVSCGRNLHKLMNRQFEGVLSDLPDKCSSSSDTTCSCSCGDEDTPIDPCKLKNKKAKKHVLKCQEGTVLQSTISSQCNTCKDEVIKDCCPEQYPQIYAQESPSIDDYSTVNAPNQPEIFSVCSSRKKKKTHQRKAKDSRKISEFTFHSHGIHLQAKWPSPPEERFCCGPNGYEKVSSCCDHGSLQSGCHAGPGCTSIKACSKSCHEGRCKCCSPRKPYPHASYFEREPRCCCSCNQNQISAFGQYEPTDREGETAFFQREMPSQRTTNDLLKAAIPCKCEPFDTASVNREQKGVTSERNCKEEETICESQNHLNHPCMKQSISEPRARNSPNSPGLNKCCEPCKPCKQDSGQSKPYEQCMPCKPSAVYESCESPFESNELNKSCVPSCKLNEPNKPCEPSYKPSEPCQPCEPSYKSSESYQNCKPCYKSNEPCQPCGPSYKSREPGKPCEPSYKPSEPCQPCEPSYKSSEPCQPCEPSYKPSEPCQPCDPSCKSSESYQNCKPCYKSNEPCQPCDPSYKSNEPCQPCEAYCKSDKPNKPCEPSYKSREPSKPCEPSYKSREPSKPCEPKETYKPCDPPSKPNKLYKSCDPPYKPSERYEVDKGLESKKDHSNHGKTNTDSENKTLADGAETNCKQMSPHSEDGNSNKIENGPCIPEKKKIDKENSYTFKGCHQGALNDKSRFREEHGLFCWGAEEKTSNQEFDGCAEEGDRSEPCDPCDAGPCVGGICYKSCREKQGEDTKIRPNCSKGGENKTIEDLAIREENNAETKQDYFCIGLQRQKEQQHPCEEEKQISPQKPNKYEKNEEDMKKTACNVFWPCRDPPKSKDSSLCDDWKERQRKGKNDSLRLNKRYLCKKSRRKNPKDSKSEQDSDGCSICASTQNPLQEQRSGDRKRNHSSFDNPPSKQNEILVPRRDSSIDELCRAAVKAMGSLSSSQESKSEGYDGAGHPKRLEPGVSISVEEIKRIFINQKDCYEGTKPSKKTSKDSKGGKARTWSPKALYDTFTQNYIEGRQTMPGSNTEGQKLFFQTASANSSISSRGLRKMKRLKDNTSESTKEAKHSIGPSDIPRSSTSSKHKWLQSNHKSTRANTQQKSSRMSSPLAVSGSSTDQDCSWTCEEIGPPSPCAQCCSPHPAEPYADHTINMCFGEEIHRSLLLTSNSSHAHSGLAGIKDELCLSDSLSCLCSGDKKSVTSILSDDELKCLNQSKSSNKCPVTCCCSQCIDLYVKKKQNTDGETTNQPTFRDGTQKPSETEKLGEGEKLSYQSLKEIFQKLYSEVMEPDKDCSCKKHKVSKRQERDCDKEDVQAYRRRAPEFGGCSSCKKEVRYRRMSPQRYVKEQSNQDQCEPESSHEQIDHIPRARYICCCECKCPALSGPGSNNSLTTDYTRSKQCDMRRKTETFCGPCSPASGYSTTSRFALKSKIKEGQRARHCVRPAQRCHCDTLEAFRYRDLCHQCPSDCMCKILSPKQTPESLQSSRCSLCTVPCACSARSEGRQEQILGFRQRPSSEENRLHKIMELCSGILSTYVNTCDKVQGKDLGKSKPKRRKNSCIHCSKRAQKRGEKKVKPKSPRKKSKKLRKSSSPTPPLHNSKCKKCNAISATFVDGSDALTDSRHKEKVSRAKKRRKSRSPSSVSSTSSNSLSGSLKRKSKKRRLGKKKRKGQSKYTSSGQSTSGTSLRSGTDNSSSVRSSVSSCESLGSNSDSSSFKSRLKRKREKHKRVQKKVKVRGTQTVLDKVIENKRKISDTLSCQTKRLLQLEQNIDRDFMQKKAEMNTARSEQILGSKFDCRGRFSQECAPHRSYSLCWPGKTNSLKANSYNVICGNKDAFPKPHGYNCYTSHYECSSPPRSSFALATRYYRKSPTCSRYGFKRRGCFYNFRRNASPDHTTRTKYFCPFKGKTKVSSRTSYKQQNNSRKSFDLNTEMGSPNLQTNVSSSTFGNVERQTENDTKLMSYRTSPQPHLYDQHEHEPGTQLISRNSDPSTKMRSLYGQEKTTEVPIPRTVNQKESDTARKPSLLSETFDQNEPVPQSTLQSGEGQSKLPRSLSPEFFEAGQDMTQNWQRSRPCTARTACRVLRRQSDYSTQTRSYGKPAASKKSKESQKLLQSKNDLAIGKHKTAKCHTKEPATKTSDLSDGEVCVGNIKEDRSRMFDFASFHASSCRTNNRTAPELLVPTSAIPKDCVIQEESISSIGIKEDSNKKARKVETLGEKMEMIFKISSHVVEKPRSDVAIVPCQSSAFCEEINEEHVPHKDFEGHSQIDIENIIEPIDNCENDCQIVDLTEE